MNDDDDDDDIEIIDATNPAKSAASVPSDEKIVSSVLKHIVGMVCQEMGEEGQEDAEDGEMPTFFIQ